MKTEKYSTGDTKIWFDQEAEFLIVNKNQPIFDSIIDANLLEKKYSKILIEKIYKAGFDEIHGILLELDDMLQSQMDIMETNELDMILDSFNSIFNTSFKYHKNSNGLISILFGKFNNYQEFRRNYFLTFLLKLYSGKIDILKSEEENPALLGLTDFISKFTPEYVQIYLETSSNIKFPWVLQID
jgi:hypothetical protein